MARKATIFILQARMATATEWAEDNPVLKVGRPYYDTTNRLVKIGDGLTRWNDTPYAFTGPTGPAGTPGTSDTETSTKERTAMQTHATSADQSVNNDTPRTIDGLDVSIPPNARWSIRYSLDMDGDTNNSGVIIGLVAPAGAAYRLSALAVDDQASGTAPVLSQTSGSPVSVPTVAFLAGPSGRIWVEAYITTGDIGGVMSLQFAQITVTGNNTTVKAGSTASEGRIL